MLGLVLGGGAAWGFAHLGVIEVLEEHRIKPDFIAGTSVGAVVGAMLAAGVSVAEMKKTASRVSWFKLSRLTVPRLGMLDASGIEDFLERHIGKNRLFSELETPLKVVATDIKNGEEVVFDSGRVASAVRASASIPIMFAPYDLQGTWLLDGGLVNNLPVDVAKASGCSRVIAVELIHSFSHHNPQNLAEVALLSFNIMLRYSTMSRAKSADVLIKPDVDDVSPADLSDAKALIENGRQAALMQLDKILQLA